MTTVGQLVDRTFRQYLEPPIEVEVIKKKRKTNTEDYEE